MKSIRIGNGSGFWGDNRDAPIRLAEAGALDYLTLEYLAELTMSILALMRKKDPAAGYAHDFLDVLSRLVPQLTRQPGLKIVTNAGGMNPVACAAKAREILDSNGLNNHKICVVSGDDLLPRLDDLIAAGHTFDHMDTGESLIGIRDRVVSANAYLGAQPIAEALARGADIVITGRVADASLVVGPSMHEFGWDWQDWDRLAAATVAGHLIECGAQMTGGLWMNASAEIDFANIGYPIAIIDESGNLIMTKPVGTGGAVNLETISEQLLYEVGDPARYYTPDVIADFTSIRCANQAPDAVSISSGKGIAKPESYKVSIAYSDGYMAAGMLTFLGLNAGTKARQSGKIILDKLRQIGITFEQSHIEVLGAGSVVPGVIKPTSAPVETVLRLAVRDANKKNLDRFSKEFAPLVTSGYAGTTGYTTGRPQVREVYAYWPSLIGQNEILANVDII
jgi:hypothetical protein